MGLTTKYIGEILAKLGIWAYKAWRNGKIPNPGIRSKKFILHKIAIILMHFKSIFGYYFLNKNLLLDIEHLQNDIFHLNIHIFQIFSERRLKKVYIYICK